MKKCSIEGCVKPSQKRGWCDVHYYRWRVNGDPMISKKAANGSGYTQGGYRGFQVNGKRTFEHVSIAELALGKKLPSGAVVHHVNENRLDNRNENLVICQDRAYHNLIHARMRALDATGDANKRPCRYCKQYDDLKNLKVYPRANTTSYWHPQCNRNAAKEKYHK